jgi:hypothetical protein
VKAGNTGIYGTACRVDCFCIRANDRVGAQGGSKCIAVKWFLIGMEKEIVKKKGINRMQSDFMGKNVVTNPRG